MQKNPVVEVGDIFELDADRASEIEEFVQQKLILMQMGGDYAVHSHRAIIDYCQTKNETAYAFLFVGGFVADMMAKGEI